MALPPVPPSSWATSATYPAGSQDWAGQPPRVQPSAGKRAQGFTPLTNLPFEEINWLFGIALDWVLSLSQIVLGTMTAKGLAIDGVGGASGGVSFAGPAHILIQQPSGSPSVALGAGSGGTPTLSAAPTTDATGIITITTGTSPVSSGVIATLTFLNAYGSTPQAVILSPRNFNAAALSGTSQVVASILSTTQWQIQAGSVSLAAATIYSWQYSIIG